MSRLEGNVQNDILIDMGALRDMLLLRNSIGATRYVDEETGREYHVPYGLGKGSPDLVAILKVYGVGIWFCLELKKPGGKPEAHQRQVHKIWRTFGAYVDAATSVEEARGAYERAKTWARQTILAEMAKEARR